MDCKRAPITKIIRVAFIQIDACTPTRGINRLLFLLDWGPRHFASWLGLEFERPEGIVIGSRTTPSANRAATGFTWRSAGFTVQTVP